MNFHGNRAKEGPPCRHMEGFLNQAADGSAGTFVTWYATSHAARCERCGRYLDRVKETIAVLRETREGEVPPEALIRLQQGPWLAEVSGGGKKEG